MSTYRDPGDGQVYDYGTGPSTDFGAGSQFDDNGGGGGSSSSTPAASAAPPSASSPSSSGRVYNYTIRSNGQEYHISNYLPPDQFANIASQNGLQIVSSQAAPGPTDNPTIHRNDSGSRYSNPSNLPRVLIVDPESGVVNSALVDGTDARQFGSVADLQSFQQQSGETQSIATHDGQSAIRVARMWTGDNNYNGYPATPSIQSGSPASRGVDFTDWYSTPIGKGGGGSGGSILNPGFSSDYDPNTSPYPPTLANPSSFSPFYDPKFNQATPSSWPTPGQVPGGGVDGSSAGGKGNGGPGGAGGDGGIDTKPLSGDDFDKLLKSITASGAGVRDTAKGLIQLNLSRMPFLSATADKINNYSNTIFGMMNSSTDKRDSILSSLQAGPTAFQSTLNNYFDFSMSQRDQRLGQFQSPDTYEATLRNQLFGTEAARQGNLDSFRNPGQFEGVLNSLSGLDRATRDQIVQKMFGPNADTDKINQMIDQQSAARTSALNSAFSPMMKALQGFYDNADDATGMSPEQKTALQTQASEGIAQNFLNAKKALNTQLLQSGAVGGGETGQLPGDEGQIVDKYGNLLAQQAGAESQARTNINLQDAQQAFQALMANRQLASAAIGQGTNIFNSAASAYSPVPLLSALQGQQSVQNTTANVAGNIYNPSTDLTQSLQAAQNRVNQANVYTNAYPLDPIVQAILGLAGNRTQNAGVYSNSYASMVPSLLNAIQGQQQVNNQTAQTYGQIYDPTAYLPGLTNFTSQLPSTFNAGTQAFNTAGGNANTLAELDPSSFKNIVLASLMSSATRSIPWDKVYNGVGDILFPKNPSSPAGGPGGIPNRLPSDPFGFGFDTSTNSLMPTGGNGSPSDRKSLNY